MNFATLDHARVKGGTAIGWCWWPDTKGETLTSIRGCKWAKYFDAAQAKWVYFETCSSCYAQATAHSLCTRFDSPHYRGLTKATARGPIWNGEIRFDEEQLLAVLRRTAAATFFLTSMGDLFYEAVSDEIIAYHVAVMIMARRHRFLVLSKRPDRMAKLLNSQPFWASVVDKIGAIMLAHPIPRRRQFGILTKDRGPNIWWGTSIENRPSANWALNELMKIQAPGRLWTSFEPMLEYVDLTPWLTSALPLPGHPNLPNRLSWVVIGGSSKQGKAEAPAYDLRSAQAVIDDCAHAGIACFHKQLGANPVDWDESAHELAPRFLREHDNHNADPQHWPRPLQVQQFPVAA